MVTENELYTNVKEIDVDSRRNFFSTDKGDKFNWEYEIEAGGMKPIRLRFRDRHKFIFKEDKDGKIWVHILKYYEKEI